jgi:hypothetical protein
MLHQSICSDTDTYVEYFEDPNRFRWLSSDLKAVWYVLFVRGEATIFQVN